MQKKSAFSIVFWSFLVLISFYLSGFPGILAGIVAFVFYVIIAYALTIFWNFITKKPLIRPKEFFLAFSYRIAVFMTFLLLFFSIFCVYQNKINPAYLPRYTLTNGKKTVVFQTMAHIATDRFYNVVKNKIKEAKLDGYTLFYEGVQPGKEENKKKFNEAMGVVFDKSLYANISKLYGLREQRNDEFLGIVNREDENVDISIDDIVALYERRLKEGKRVERTTPPINIAPLVDESVKSLGTRELQVLIYVNQAIMNFIMKNDSAQQAIMTISGQDDIFGTILHDRNDHLAKAIIDSKSEKIIILYGMLHFEGIYGLLQENDPNWKVTKVEFEYPIR